MIKNIVMALGDAAKPGIVLGAHFDTPFCATDTGGDDDGCLNAAYGPYPGANDDGSGVVTVLEIANVLLNSHMKFNKPIYLIFYAGEEDDDLGSIAVVDNFKKNNIPVDAVLQLDQVGFAYNNEETMYLETDPKDHVVDDKLTQYLFTLIKTYVKKPVQFSCSGESDEESWSTGGFITARALESDYCHYDHMYQYMHSNEDTMEKLSLVHMTDYLKLALAFAVELAEPVSK